MRAENVRKIEVLAPEEARRIAAGEVIDRPSALVREFLDNAIDAESGNIDVSIEDGGSKKVEISDDGAGMNYDDLNLCWLTHSTSKIRGLDDLDIAKTLGFRGEALAAVSAVARLEIITSADGREAWKLETGPGEKHPPKLEQTRRTKGTTVRAINLFESIPARKRFLKREGSEAVLCKQAFIDKALAFNNISFRFYQDGKQKVFLPAVQTKKERFAAAIMERGEVNFLHEIYVSNEGFSAAIVIGGPELYRNDRRQLFIFANGRRIQDYALIQAIEYGCAGWFPNGTHPIGAAYIEIDPALADFNIHPAKREVRFRDSGAIHHAVSGGIKNFFHSLFLRTSRREGEGGGDREDSEFFSRRDAETQRGDREFISHKDTEARRARREEFGFTTNNNIKSEGTDRFEKFQNFLSASLASLRLGENSLDSSSVPPCLREKTIDTTSEAKYAGRAFGLFILIEWGNKLYIIDQHAAHERILYNKFMNSPIPKQELLTPIPFNTESDDEDAFLEAKKEELSRLGVDIEKDESGLPSGSWRIEALPSDWRLSDGATVKEILNLRTAGENMAERWAATLCCRAAIKDGDYPDDDTAFALGKEALALRETRCPHGRPIWTEIGKEALYKAVRRLE